MDNMNKFTRIIAVLTVLLAGACTTVQTTQSGAVGVERKQRMLLSDKQVENMSAQMYAQTLQEADAKDVLNPNSAQTQRIRGIANRLIAQVGIFRPDAKNWKWEVNVLQNDAVNAYAMAGGKIMVYTGLIEKIKATDAELAAVIGHEIAHALREHTREQMSEAYATQIGLLGVAAAIGIATGDANNANTTLGLGSSVAAVALTLPHSRRAETEADQIGLELMARAGYDPNAAVSLWEKMSKAGGNKPPEFLSTHPADTTRIAEIKRLIPKVMSLYQASTKR